MTPNLKIECGCDSGFDCESTAADLNIECCSEWVSEFVANFTNQSDSECESESVAYFTEP